MMTMTIVLLLDDLRTPLRARTASAALAPSSLRAPRIGSCITPVWRRGSCGWSQLVSTPDDVPLSRSDHTVRVHQVFSRVRPPKSARALLRSIADLRRRPRAEFSDGVTSCGSEGGDSASWVAAAASDVLTTPGEDRPRYLMRSSRPPSCAELHTGAQWLACWAHNPEVPASVYGISCTKLEARSRDGDPPQTSPGGSPY